MIQEYRMRLFQEDGNNMRGCMCFWELYIALKGKDDGAFSSD